MKKTKKIILTILFFVSILLITDKVNATSISASPSSPKKGKPVTITVSVPNVNTVDLTATVSGAGTSGTIRLVDGSMTGEAKTFSKSITVTPTSAGTIKVVVSSGSNAVLNGQYVNVSASKSITVTEPPANTGGSSSGGNSSSGSSNGSSSSSTGTSSQKPTTNTTKPVETPKSTDSTLSALSIKEGAINPEFKKDVKEYSLTIPYETSEVNVTATANDSKAKVTIEGNKELKEGENTVKVLVTAENGTSTTYTIKVTRKRVPIALKTLVVKYQNENGELIETPLNPAFNFDTLEYTLQDLEYWVEKLNIEAIPNIEGATIDIQGADNLQVGENTITITVKIAEENTPEGEEAKEETITYTIKFNKIAEPTLIAKIQDWFKGIFGGIGSWYNNNQDKVILGALGVCIVALIGLSVYIVVDYNKYKDVIAKVKKVTELNSNEVAVEEIEQESNIVEEKNIEDNNKNDRPKGGKHF